MSERKICRCGGKTVSEYHNNPNDAETLILGWRCHGCGEWYKDKVVVK